MEHQYTNRNKVSQGCIQEYFTDSLIQTGCARRAGGPAHSQAPEARVEDDNWQIGINAGKRDGRMFKVMIDIQPYPV
jgi:hypothetical protein